MKRLDTPRREWARFGVKMAMVAGMVLVFFVFFGVYRVEGNSMAPDVKDGDLLIYSRFLPAEVGGLVVDGSARRVEEADGVKGKVL